MDQRVENIEDGVAAPGIGVFAQELVFFIRRGALTGDAVAVAAEGFELVDEFVDDVPGPVVLCEEDVSSAGCKGVDKHEGGR